jgi:hypothetical protein
LISSGRVSLAEVQALLGHASPAMTQRYAHLIPGTGDNVREALDGLSNATSSLSASPPVDNRVTTEAGSPETAADTANHSEQLE